MKRIILLTGLLSMVVLLNAADRYIWLHGLEGEKGSNTWDIYRKIFSPDNGYILEYTSDNSIENIARNLYTTQIKPLDTGSSIVVIGHSMGGLVARSLPKYSSNISGVIAVGAANNGSTLLKNTLSGVVYDYFTEAIKEANSAIDASLWSGIFSGYPVTTLAAPLILPITVFKNKTVNSTLNVLKQVLNSGIGIYKLGHPCVRDMVPGSSYLSTLNSVNSAVPTLNIYGAEDHWQVLRALGSLSKVEEVKNPVNIDTSYDKSYFPAVQSGLAFIYQIQTTHNLVYNALGLAAVLMPWIWVTRELVLKARFNWDAMYRYLESGIHTDLAGALGAVQYQLGTYCVPKGVSLTTLSCKSAYLPYVTENDGILSRKDVVLPSNSQRPVFNIKVTGVNHQEMGNHAAMRKLFQDIINFKTYGNVFAKKL